MNRKRYYFEIIKYGYLNLMKNSLVVTNSKEFSRKAISKIFKLDDIRILSPPIDVETFRNAGLMINGYNEKKDSILVISRIAPHKKIEKRDQARKNIKG